MSARLVDWLSRLSAVTGDARRGLIRIACKWDWDLEDFAHYVIDAPAFPQPLLDIMSPFEMAVVQRVWREDFQQKQWRLGTFDFLDEGVKYSGEPYAYDPAVGREAITRARVAPQVSGRTDATNVPPSRGARAAREKEQPRTDRQMWEPSMYGDRLKHPSDRKVAREATPDRRSDDAGPQQRQEEQRKVAIGSAASRKQLLTAKDQCPGCGCIFAFDCLFCSRCGHERAEEVRPQKLEDVQPHVVGTPYATSTMEMPSAPLEKFRCMSSRFAVNGARPAGLPVAW
mmetsp:Transcript_41213/g.92547  ORF Transcript_41213/g.92547 Transcript_41213/m.92547 type:complete len:285 (+) Transcript_41213:58-912(+)